MRILLSGTPAFGHLLPLARAAGAAVVAPAARHVDAALAQVLEDGTHGARAEVLAKEIATMELPARVPQRLADQVPKG